MTISVFHDPWLNEGLIFNDETMPLEWIESIVARKLFDKVRMAWDSTLVDDNFPCLMLTEFVTFPSIWAKI
ncbi:hypothetical protein ES332_A02G057200v1 [Gossypium tomentosum]|uniref:Uncharacterized protein n=1 Tax=Gossypium tomentosum TaxID=34277 RepID=A0A5D2REF0_GOSTO|nr:hypothetical protein ES332_A02G057200v1 [Gossypium tomentosum]